MKISSYYTEHAALYYILDPPPPFPPSPSHYYSKSGNNYNDFTIYDTHIQDEYHLHRVGTNHDPAHDHSCQEASRYLRHLRNHHGECMHAGYYSNEIPMHMEIGVFSLEVYIVLLDKHGYHFFNSQTVCQCRSFIKCYFIASCYLIVLFSHCFVYRHPLPHMEGPPAVG